MISVFCWNRCVTIVWIDKSAGRIERHRIQSRLQALSCQHRAWCGAQTHELWDHDLRQSRTLNWLGHPGTPEFLVLIQVCGNLWQQPWVTNTAEYQSLQISSLGSLFAKEVFVSTQHMSTWLSHKQNRQWCSCLRPVSSPKDPFSFSFREPSPSLLFSLKLLSFPRIC